MIARQIPPPRIPPMMPGTVAAGVAMTARSTFSGTAADVSETLNSEHAIVMWIDQIHAFPKHWRFCTIARRPIPGFDAPMIAMLRGANSGVERVPSWDGAEYRARDRPPFGGSGLHRDQLRWNRWILNVNLVAAPSAIRIL